MFSKISQIPFWICHFKVLSDRFIKKIIDSLPQQMMWLHTLYIMLQHYYGKDTLT